MRSLFHLAIHDDRVRNIFIQIGADPFLHLIHRNLMRENDAKNDRLMLLSACRRAMVCTEENIINGFAKDLSNMLDPAQNPDAVCLAEASIRWVRLQSVQCNR